MSHGGDTGSAEAGARERAAADTGAVRRPGYSDLTVYDLDAVELDALSADQDEPTARAMSPRGTGSGDREAFGDAAAETSTPRAGRIPGQRIDADPESVERGLVTLVLTIVELLRQLMERQALRRVDQGDLTEDQIEKIGITLMALEERMAELRDHFGLRPEDLNLDLGPLGPLLPYD